MSGSRHAASGQATDAEALLALLAAGRLVRVEKPWGIEHMLTLPNDAGILKVIHVKDGHSTSLQHHQVKREVTYVLEAQHGGGVHVEHAGHAEYYPAGQHVELAPGTVHRSVGPCLLLEFTTPENDDVVRHHDRYGRVMMP